MMAKKCDICGTLYELQCTPDVRVNIYSHPYGDRWLDLCPKCQEQLERFVCVRMPCSSNAPVLEKATPGSFTREILYDDECCRTIYEPDTMDRGRDIYD